MSSVHEPSAVPTKESRTVESDCHKREERGKLLRMDSRFKIMQAEGCHVLHHLIQPTTLVAVPDSVLTERGEDDEEARKVNGEAPNIVIVTDKQEALWWDSDTLKTNAPDRCSEESLFDMTIVSTTKQGREVQFKSHIKGQYLVIMSEETDQGEEKEPQFTFKLSPTPDVGITSTFILGTDSSDGDEPNYLYLKFQVTKEGGSEEWYYWYIDGDKVKIRKTDASEMFNTKMPPCPN